MSIKIFHFFIRPKQNIEHVFNSSDFSETVKPHEGRKRIENPEPGVYVALYYALANVIILRLVHLLIASISSYKNSKILLLVKMVNG